MNGQQHWFGVPGIANGLAVLRDEETNSLWDHITGECFDGPLTGEKLDFWFVNLTTVAAELAQHADAVLLKSDYRSLKQWGMSRFFGNNLIGKKGTTLPPRFHQSMNGEIDGRLDKGVQGLGVMDELNHGKFYPLQQLPKGGVIEDEWLGRRLKIERSALDGVPFATWLDADEPPMQLLTRWYGFSFTMPGCEIYEG